MTGFCTESTPTLEKAKASSLWRLVTKAETFEKSKQLLDQDPTLAKWTLKDMGAYVKARTQDIKERAIAVQRDIEKERSKAASLGEGFILRSKIEKIHWKGTLRLPSAVDYAVAQRLLQQGKYTTELNELRQAFDEADKGPKSTAKNEWDARRVFKSLFDADLRKSIQTRQPEPTSTSLEVTPEQLKKGL